MKRIAALLPVLLLTVLVASALPARASASVDPATGGEAISADTTGGPFTALSGPTISEAAAGDIGIGLISLQAPAGFEFSTDQIVVDTNPPKTRMRLSPTATCSGAKREITVTPSAEQVSFTVCKQSVGGQRSLVSLVGLQVRPVAGAPLASGDIRLAPASTASIVGVDGSTSLGALTEVAGAPAVIDITPQAATVLPNSQLQFAATLTDAFGNPVEGAIAWSVDPALDATIDQTGLLSAGDSPTSSSEGVTATHGDLSASAAVSIQPGDIHDTILLPHDVFTDPGVEHEFRFYGFPGKVDLTDQSTFTIEPEGTCDFNLCTATVGGKHFVYAEHPEHGTGGATMNVSLGEYASIRITPDHITTRSQEHPNYQVLALDENGDTLGYVTEDAQFALDGKDCPEPGGPEPGPNCSFFRAGESVLEARINGYSDTADVTITPNQPIQITISPRATQVAPGQAVAYKARGYDGALNDAGDVTADTAFTIDGLPCDGNLCSSSELGDHDVVGTYADVPDRYDAATADALLHVADGVVNEIEISPALAAIIAGEPQTYTVVAHDSNDVTWDVTDEAAISIEDGTCDANVCTATKAGDHAVTATLGDLTAGATLHVDMAPVEQIALDPPTAETPAGVPVAFTATGSDAYGNTTDLTESALFTIDGAPCEANSCSSTIAGEYPIEATAAGLVGNGSLFVRPAQAASLVLNPLRATVEAGVPQAFTAHGVDAFGNETGDVTGQTDFFISGAPCGASNECASTTTGEKTVRGEYLGATGYAFLDVVAGPPARMTLTPSNAEIGAGEPMTYSANGYDSYDNATGDLSDEATFTINGEPCDANVCSSRNAGTYTVTATHGSLMADAQLKVTAGPPTWIGAVFDPVEIVADGASQTTLTATVYDQYANDISVDEMTATPVGDLGVGLLTAEGNSWVATVTASTTAGEEHITLAAAGITGDALIHELPGAPSILTLEAGSPTVEASTVETHETTITATLTDPEGNPIPFRDVSITLTQNESGAGGLLTQPLVLPAGWTTDENGQVAATYRSGALPGIDEITATAGALSSTIAIRVVLPVVCGAGAPEPVCPAPGRPAPEQPARDSAILPLVALPEGL